MKKEVKRIVLLLLFVVLILLLIWAYRSVSSNKDPAKDFPKSSEKNEIKENEDKQIIDSTIYNSKNEKVLLTDIVKGKPAVINFWASWCSVCEAELPDFESSYKTHGKDINFIMINLTDGQRETKDSANSTIQKNNYSFPVYYDHDMSASDAYKVYSIPTTIFVDSKGKIVDIHLGMLNEKSLKEKIELIS